MAISSTKKKKRPVSFVFLATAAAVAIHCLSPLRLLHPQRQLQADSLGSVQNADDDDDDSASRERRGRPGRFGNV